MILILGGGLAGLSTAYHLETTEHLVLEADATAGGLCRSREVDGFVFDYTGHLLHLRDERVIRLVDRLLPDAFELIERRARIRSHGVTVPFPFQAHLHGLPREVVADCLIGFAESLAVPVPDDPEVSFKEWSLAVFGDGISRVFMLPYNEKLFRRAAESMTADWVSWAVPKPSLEQVVRGALGAENRGMGYNSRFRYPRHGGIGLFPEALARRVERIRLESRVVEIDLARRVVKTDDGDELRYDVLVNTLPLPAFMKMTRGGPDVLREAAGRLDWSVVGCVNLGVDRSGLADGAHWIYFPDRDVPFYRAGFPSNFSGTVAPEGAGSIYVEFGLRRGETIDRESLTATAVRGLREQGILTQNDRVLASDVIRIDPGYVIFDRERQRAMRTILPRLEAMDVHSIGRYGAWTYSYMERAVLDGMELAERLLQGHPA
jgi:protoporphyrinogen oxidase